MVAIGAALHGATVLERGSFRLHKMESPIGRETYSIQRDGNQLVMESDFLFRDRGTSVPLKSTLEMAPDYAAARLRIQGKTSRFSTIDQTLVPPGYTIAAYAPVSVQMAMVRYWASHGRPDAIPRAGGGQIRIIWRGRDTAGSQQLDRFSVTGLIWGRETLWFDAALHLAAAISIDAEFDHFEAVADSFESSLPFFVGRAAEDSMAALGELAAGVAGAPQDTIAISGATLIDGTGSAPVPDAVIVTRGGRILAAGARGSVTIPGGAQMVDARGRYVIPGLWDMHAHFEQVEWGPVYLAAGVTTARDCGNEFEFIRAVRDVLAAGRGTGPRLLLAGIVDGDSPRALSPIRANDAAQAAAVVKKYVDARFDQIKIYSSVKPEVVKALCREAHRRGVTVTGHVPFGMNAREAVEDGMDGIEHFHYIQQVLLPASVGERMLPFTAVNLSSTEARDGIRFFARHGTVVDPTLALYEWLWHEKGTPVERFEPGVAKVAPQLREPLENVGLPAREAGQTRAVLQSLLRAVTALKRAGVPVIAGTDQTIPGWSLHRELELFVQGGMTPMEAIEAATMVPARVMKLDGEVGTVQAGRRADLVLLDADPLADIRNTRRIWRVMAAGRLYDPAPLWASVGFRMQHGSSPR